MTTMVHCIFRLYSKSHKFENKPTDVTSIKKVKGGTSLLRTLIRLDDIELNTKENKAVRDRLIFFTMTGTV